MLRSIRANKTEAKNGWDNKTLQAYIIEREAQSSRLISTGFTKPPGPSVENCWGYSALKGWRK